ncbi:dihydroorotate dehydrogenase electron transfer subunit [Peptoniphilus equinus]|uniref:Dihydroorotate dehydrogenase electron transfer subunit n=1 Tax=Peptoniphilus equinus TaxID=3016343 RepID=A0ABY7QSM4_9FIRM|nr:dihydroorotate dehydrogenase electron transfer subunit [Peptoniphilus equinus]WBW49789.1 dihydroorotate dehydrogenase electron transfer subunit [Peptoniphilus equinus]
MAKVLWNTHIDSNYYLIKVDQVDDVKPGQFYMLRAWDKYPILSRPISIYDADEEGLTFFYEVRGEGTQRIRDLEPGDELTCYGPYGNSFNAEGVDAVTLVGGSVGAAPFYYLAKVLRRNNPKCRIEFYLGERETQSLETAFSDLDVNLHVKKGGLITEDLTYDTKLLYTCGPDPMMRAVTLAALDAGCDVMISLDNRMGCGVGACLSCTCTTKSGNKRACVEGPVFEGGDVYGK